MKEVEKNGIEVPEVIHGELPGEIILVKKPGYNYEGTGFGIHFQEGATKETEINGIVDMDLINILIHKLKFHQEESGGIYCTKQNACAITHLQEAYNWLLARREDRKRRSVYGTRKV